MGRPINKKWFGTQTGTSEGDYPNIPVEAAFIGGKIVRSDDGGSEVFIVKQKSARRFLVQSQDEGEQAVCKLVNKVTDSSAVAAGEMVIVGHLASSGGDGGQAINIMKMTNRVATSFNGTRYKWSVTDDSTANVLVLTAM